MSVDFVLVNNFFSVGGDFRSGLDDFNVVVDS